MMKISSVIVTVLLWCQFAIAQTTQAPPLNRWPTIYYSESIFTMNEASVPDGCLPMMNDGGGRFDSDLVKDGYQEKSFWNGGYYGARTDVFLPDLYLFTRAWPRTYFYATDIETWPIWHGVNTDAEVQQSLDKLNAMYDVFNRERPDMIWGTYAIAPVGSYWPLTNWQMSVDAYLKWKSGQALTDKDRWALGGAFKTTASGYVKYNADAQFSKDFRAWVNQCLRITYNTDGRGKKQPTAGFVSRLRVLCPELYAWTGGDPVVENVAHVRWQVAMARRLTEGKKPVYGYVWNRKHVDGFPYMTLDEYRGYIRSVFATGVDGVILWGFEKGDQPYVTITLEEREYAARQAASYFMDWKTMPWPESLP